MSSVREVTVAQSFSLVGRVALVTGAGRGLGVAAAAALSEAGATVVLTGRDILALKKIADDLAGATEVEQLDVTNPEQIADTFDRIVDRHGRLDVLLNNAGIAYDGRLADTTPQDWDRVIDVNLKGTFLCTKALAARRSLDSPPASVINVSSIGAAAGISTQSAYCASKGGVESLTRALALELARSGTRVNAIAPGYFRTDMPASVLASPELEDQLVRRIPLVRIAEPAEFGPPIVFLASDASRYMTGAILRFDGGYTAR